jgi:hypothetical protein
MSGSTFWSPG